MKKIDKLKNEIEKHIQQLGCPPNGDGTKADGSPDARCSKGGGSSRGGGSGRGSKEKTIDKSGNINQDRSKEILNKSVEFDERGNSIAVPISKDEMNSIKNNIDKIKETKKGETYNKYHLSKPNERTGRRTISKVSSFDIQGGGKRLGLEYEIGYLDESKGTFRLNDSKGSRGFTTGQKAFDLFTGK